MNLYYYLLHGTVGIPTWECRRYCSSDEKAIQAGKDVVKHFTGASWFLSLSIYTEIPHKDGIGLIRKVKLLTLATRVEEKDF